MALLERREDGAAEIEDRLTRLGDEDALPGSGGVLVSYSRFSAEREALLSRDGGLGV